MTIVHYIVYIYWGMFGRGSDRRRDVFSTLALLTVLPLSQQAAWSQHSPAQFFHLFFQRNFNLNKTHSNLLHTIQTHKKASGDKIEQVTAKIQKSWRTRVCEIWVQSKSTIQYNAPRSRFFGKPVLVQLFGYIIVFLPWGSIQ